MSTDTPLIVVNVPDPGYPVLKSKGSGIPSSSVSIGRSRTFEVEKKTQPLLGTFINVFLLVN